jgi:sugar phosphate isomerase/epimerase
MSWRVGISTGGCTERSILDVLPAIREAGATGVEIGTPPRHFDPFDACETANLERGLAESGLDAVSIHTPFGGSLDLADPEPHHRHAAICAALTAGAALGRLGGRLVIVHPSDLKRHEQDVPARLADAAESLAHLADHCARAGLTLVVESPLPHLIGGSPDEFESLLRDLPPAVGVCLDTGHTHLGGHWHQFLEVAGQRLMHVHANDNRGSWDDHLPPGDGHVDWDAIARSLTGAGFTGWIMLELSCPGTWPLNGYLRDAYDRTIALLQP